MPTSAGDLPASPEGFDAGSVAYLEGLYADFARDPDSVPPSWRRAFESLDERAAPSSHRRVPAEEILEAARLQHFVDILIRAYRIRGHTSATIDPLGRPRPSHPELDPAFHGLTEADMDRLFYAEGLSPGQVLPLREILARLKETYCRSIGVQYMHIDDLKIRRWLQARMEETQNRMAVTGDLQDRLLDRLVKAVSFEAFIQKKYPGAKSFSLEGAESLLPLLELAVEQAAEQGVQEIVLGMSHRGRLNVLANLLGKAPHVIFREFEGHDPQRFKGRGDVKYHLGASRDWETASGKRVHLSLCFNPSHLEYVDPVVLGRTRAKQDREGDTSRQRALALIVHGDAAFAGEGVVQETLNLSQLPAYTVGGTLHVIVNNQIGFTTEPEQGRSTAYATDIARTLQIPIFHVNGEDPEAVAQALGVAMDFRATFHRDVVVDMYAFRRHGHNEGDEPSFTQPQMVAAIQTRPPLKEIYMERLVAWGGEMHRQRAQAGEAAYLAHLEAEYERAQTDAPSAETPELQGIWATYRGGRDEEVPDVATGVAASHLKEVLSRLAGLPEGFVPHPRLDRLLKPRRQMARGERPLDWSAAEALALATLALEGHRIRLTGQDTERGTFSQRHAVLHDFENGRTFVPLQYLDPRQAVVEIANSPLSEAGCLGFEYGYSLDCPAGLVIWEAQFGDFVNAAQVIVDQFLCSAEDKWRRLSGLTLFLPHGYEGQGPEHSSARLERFLTLAADDNLQVVVPTTPAQIFHVLRRQVLRPLRKPLVLLTPKSLLRLPAARSPLEDLTGGSFSRILADPSPPAGRPRRVLLCAGKVFYDLDEARRQQAAVDVLVLRLEQIFPLSDALLSQALANVPEQTPVLWVQEEPENMGAWPFLRLRLGHRLPTGHSFSGVCRPASASPATGSHTAHRIEQEHLVATALGTPALKSAEAKR